MDRSAFIVTAFIFTLLGAFAGFVAGRPWPTEHLAAPVYTASTASTASTAARADSWSGTNGWEMIDCIDGDVHWKPRGNTCFLADKPN